MRHGRSSRTAVFVCQGRAVADGRLGVGRFSDPIATQVLTDEERDQVSAARSDGLPRGTRARLSVESLRACAEVVAPRTVLIDEAVDAGVRDGGIAQVVLLGAGLDTRPWRLSSLAATTVLVVDHPDSQADFEARTGRLDPLAGHLVRVPVDLTVEPLAPALAGAGHHRTEPTLWLWEGVVPYLTRAAVSQTVAAIEGLSAPGSRLIVNYQTPSLTTRAGRRMSEILARGLRLADVVTIDEPWRSLWSPQRMEALLGQHGFTVERDVDLLEAAKDLDLPTNHARSLGNGRIALARA